MAYAATKEPTASWVDIAVRGNRNLGHDGGEKEYEAEQQNSQAWRGVERQAEDGEAIQRTRCNRRKSYRKRVKDRKGVGGW